jgi:hypothetical protein
MFARVGSIIAPFVPLLVIFSTFWYIYIFFSANTLSLAVVPWRTIDLKMADFIPTPIFWQLRTLFSCSAVQFWVELESCQCLHRRQRCVEDTID